MFLAHLAIRIAAIALLCTALYQGGQYASATLNGVTAAMQVDTGSGDWGVGTPD